MTQTAQEFYWEIADRIVTGNKVTLNQSSVVGELNPAIVVFDWFA